MLNFSSLKNPLNRADSLSGPEFTTQYFIYYVRKYLFTRRILNRGSYDA
jgi:hypothetical protein